MFYLILTVRPRQRPPQAVRAAAVEVAHELPVHRVRPVLARVAAEAPAPEAEGRIQGNVGNKAAPPVGHERVRRPREVRRELSQKTVAVRERQ